MISQKMMFELIKIAEAKGDYELLNAFWNTYYCMDQIVRRQRNLNFQSQNLREY